MTLPPVIPPMAGPDAPPPDPLANTTKADISTFISDWLNRVVTEGVSPTNGLTPFHGLEVPGITVAAYLQRISLHTRCSKSVIVIAMIYMDRVVKEHPRVTVTPNTVHRLLAISVTVAAKFHDDYHFDNATYAHIGGITTKEIGRLELYFLDLIEFRLYVSPEEYRAAAWAYIATASGADPIDTSRAGSPSTLESIHTADSGYSPTCLK